MLGSYVRSAAVRPMLLLVLALAVALVVACGDDDEGENRAAADSEGQERGTITIAWIPGWAEDVAATFLWQHLLEERGYDVKLTQLDAGPVFAGLSQGEIDLYLDAWLPTTHATYWEQYGADLERLGVWYDNARLTLAVPEYVEAASIAGLPDYAQQFDRRIVGIEPGAGEMRIVQNEVMPGYGLTDWTLVDGSTPAMLAELESASDDDEWVVVTLWRPHWAYAEFPIRDLEDPQGLMGDAENMVVVGRNGFSEDYPQVAEWFGTFEMGDQPLGELEALINELGEGNEPEAVEQWLEQEEHRELVDGWLQE